MNDLEEKLRCIMSGMGAEIGALIRCMIEQEVAAHVSRIEQLQALLGSDTCDNSAVIPTENVQPPA